MFGSIGMPELILIFIVALIVFGPKKLPEIGKSIGKGLAEFKRASDDLKRTIESEIEQGKTEAAAVKEQFSGVHQSVQETVSATTGFAAEGGPSTGPAAAPAPDAAPPASPVQPATVPDSRPIEPS
ncbi:MAG TPA: twin-arginine translocase TatA/TatE family subunit [Thermoanaerobaculia bacterium]|jgi:TatA/E family protein of Tat protein translocase|nr:twin-arginine translocase TatA/TatE family subunit [Thermoanaerobaculia bacterium]